MKKKGGMFSDKNWILKGTAPNEKNFQNFNLGIKELLIHFPPYQVAPYAAGEQVVGIPYNQLKTVIKSNDY